MARRSYPAPRDQARKRPPTGAPPPQNGEAHNDGNRAGFRSKKANQHANDSGTPNVGKPRDSRTLIIDQAREAAKTKSARISLSIATSSPEKIAALEAIHRALPGVSAHVQEARLEQAIRRWPLTSLEMFTHLDLYDPRARVQGLRKRGLAIVMSWVLVQTACGELHRVGRFHLQRGMTVEMPAHRQVGLFDGAAA